MHVDTITITGLVATEPRIFTTEDGLTIFSCRVASRSQKFDKATSKWVAGETNWYTVSAFRFLASNCASSISLGDRVVVTGRLRLKQWDNGDRHGMTAQIEADAIGHDLTWGATVYSPTFPRTKDKDSAVASPAESAPESEGQSTAFIEDAQPTPF